MELRQTSEMEDLGEEVLQENKLPHPLPVPMARFDRQNVSDEEDVDINNMSDEDAVSLMNLSISRAATHITSPRTPAAEKAALIEDWGGQIVDSDDETPPAQATSSTDTNPPQLEEEMMASKPKTITEKVLSSEPQAVASPSLWQTGSKPFITQRLEESRSALRTAFDPLKRRSFSGSGDALRKLLPSLPKTGSFMPSLSSPSFFSQKSRSRASSSTQTPRPSIINNVIPISRDSYLPSAGDLFSRTDTKQSQNELAQSSVGPLRDFRSRQLPLRRISSDHSLLYHSLSRASSLGDDTRFENQHEMINSRLKAIKDSFPDVPSFKMPSMPSFEAAMNFALSLGSGIGGPSPPKSKTEDYNTRDVQSYTGQISGTVPVPNPRLNEEVEHKTQRMSETTEITMRPAADPMDENILDRAISTLTGDIVIMGGYRGSVLRSAKPPHRQLWVPVKVGLNIRKVNMEVGLEADDEERMEETIFPSGMLKNIGPVDMSKRLFKRLQECDNAKNGSLRVWDWGYDWRLSPKLLSRKLQKFLETLPSNQPGTIPKDRGCLIIAHSLGGLITRHAINQKPELVSSVIYAGVPQSCINILGPLRNGDSVLFSDRVLTAQVNFTMRSSFVFLPLDGYGFIDQNTKEPYLVDFFKVDDWIKYRWSPCISSPLPPKSQPIGSLANMLKASSLPNLQIPGRKSSNPGSRNIPSQSQSSSFNTGAQAQQQPSSSVAGTVTAAEEVQPIAVSDLTLAPQIASLQNPVSRNQPTSTSVSTAVTIPLPTAISYLRRTLAETKQFKLELAFNPAHSSSNSYPPVAIIYGKSVPTVYAAKVDGRDGIACADAYDKLAFASGDGVCLAREAMVPEGYNVVRGGRISSDRGHVTLLGDLNAVGKAIEAVRRGREKGVGLKMERQE